ncbi:hypothetical protein GPA19_24135 [Azoarcus indigens]|uniref:hypothetical protein n=1 Tax=Azoarcus indigens TaxID=29545 RepID=UPI001060F65E|nr:hypothetical protein [Azoarcus indigens]NMG68036.1 hypothetical protein [Azoarcus indigens]
MKNRPLGVWLICAYIAWTAVGSLIGIAYAFLSGDPDAQWGRDYYRSLSLWQIIYFSFSSLLALSAAVSLFMMRKIAAPLFIGVLVLGILNAAVQVTSGWIAGYAVEALGWKGVIMSILVGMIVMCTVVFYVLRLKSRGLLV